MTTRVSSRTLPTGRRAHRRAVHQELSRVQLLDAAETVFGDKGLRSATVKDIATLAEYSVGWVYTCYASKDDLFAAVLARRGLEMTAGIAEVCDRDGSPLARLVELARYEVEFFAMRPAFARLYLRTSAVGPLVPNTGGGREVHGLLDVAMSRTATLIAEGQAAGEVCGGDPATLARLLSGLVSAYQAVDAAARDGASGAPFALDDFAALVARTFAASPSAARAATRARREPTRGARPNTSDS